MKSRALLLFLLVLILTTTVSACGNNTNTESTPTAGETNTPSGVIAAITSVPDPGETARAYLDAWANFDYVAMYNMLTTISRDAITIEAFNDRYTNVTQEAVLTGIDYEILQTLTNPESAQIGYQVTLNSALVGPIQARTQMNLSIEGGQWRVVWDDTLILPELAGGNTLSMETIWPNRGIIYDRDGTTLAADTEAVALAVIPSNIDLEVGQDTGLLTRLYNLSGINSNYYQDDIFGEDAPWILPLFEFPAPAFYEYEPYLRNLVNALSWEDYYTRLSYLHNATGHTVGWVGPIPLEEAEDWTAKGYPIDAQVGRAGVEFWAEEYLAGKPSADLYVVTPEGLLLTRLGTSDSQPSQEVYTTLDANLQQWAQLSLDGFTGAVVVLERDTGRVLAMASSPTFDPNDADPNNPNSEWSSYFSGGDDPFLNRATQGQYPPGSIFKVITASAALESGMFERDTIYDCQYDWYGPDGTVFHDWTLEKERPPSGKLSLPEGIMRSCNTYFYQIGYTLFTNGQETLVADLARGFGLGSPTGIDVLPEAGGQIVNPEDAATGEEEAWFHAIQQAIGQSQTVITPLQAAVYTAAIGNGGTLYRPQMIERIVNTAGQETYSFTPEVNGTLPISDNTLSIIREGMLLVTQNARGTAYRTFVNRGIKVWGKTGTASTFVGQEPHAWFIGYTDQQREDVPDLAIAVLLEYQGDGSEFAAPIFRRLVEVYYYGAPQSTYPWERRIGEISERYFLTDEELEALEAEEAQNNQNNP
jgi:cell division protein FtsI/penicillin-binding protein 2